MSDPRASPRPRRFGIDPRLLIGLGLVIASVAGVVAVVSASDHRVTVFAAAGTLAPGDHLDDADLLARQVKLDDTAGLYLGPGDLPDEGLVVTAGVRAGELVPLSALGTESGRDATTIVLQLAGRISGSVEPGALVDVWASRGSASDPTNPDDLPVPPSVLSADAVVTRVLRPEGIVSSADGEAVEVLVPRARIARLLQAVADGDELAIVPAGIPFSAR
jgi:hypothetical protein